MDYFYDGQIERYLLQFMRIFTNVKIENEPDSNGIRVQKRVPIKYGDMSKMVASIISGNNQNTMLTAPAMAVTIQSLKKNDKRRQDPTFVGKMHGTEREFDADANAYTSKPGNSYSIDRYMPVPYDLTLDLHIWTTNTNNKLQIMEQLLAIFNPAVQLEQNENPFDWSGLFEVTLEDITWSNRTIPVGTNSTDDVATMQFSIPIWINSPAKVKRQRLIEQIQVDVYGTSSLTDSEIQNELFNLSETLSICTITPNNLKINVAPYQNKNVITLLTKFGIEDDTLTWDSITAQYGNIIDNVTKIRLKTDDDIESTAGDIIGYVEHHPTIANKLIFTPDQDTLPSTTDGINPILKFIDATTMYPSHGLPPAAYGQRYAIVSPFTNGEEAAIKDKQPWGNLEAYEGDIIEYNGTQWVVIFDSVESVGDKFIINLEDGQHYKYNGEEWIYTYLGTFNPGFWKVENLDKQ